MDRQLVKRLEEEVERAIARAIRERLIDDLPINLSPRTIHLMAKAAVTVLEAVAENSASG